jgi:hypothetical protein
MEMWDWSATSHVGTTAPACPANRSSALWLPPKKSPPAEANGDCYKDFKLKGSDPSVSYTAFSLACATLKIVLSSKCRPRICSPMGNFALVSPQGTEMPGIPARSAVTV